MPARFSKRDFWNLGEIWDRDRWTNTFLSKTISSKKNPKTFWSNFFWTIFFYFWSKTFSLKKSMKIQNFEISKIFQKIKILDFHWLFQRHFFDHKSKNFGPKNFRPNSFRFFSTICVFDKHIFVHLFRSQISPRFQKSRLEKRAGIKKIRKGWPGTLGQKWTFFPTICGLRYLRFKNLLYNSNATISVVSGGRRTTAPIAPPPCPL